MRNVIKVLRWRFVGLDALLDCVSQNSDLVSFPMAVMK